MKNISRTTYKSTQTNKKKHMYSLSHTQVAITFHYASQYSWFTIAKLYSEISFLDVYSWTVVLPGGSVDVFHKEAHESDKLLVADIKTNTCTKQRQLQLNLFCWQACCPHIILVFLDLKLSNKLINFLMLVHTHTCTLTFLKLQPCLCTVSPSVNTHCNIGNVSLA